MAKSPIWKGSKALNPVPESPEIVEDKDGSSVVITYEGPYDRCKSDQPDRGQSISGYAGLVVERTRINRGAGGRGRLVIECQTPSPQPSSGGGITGGPPQYELDQISINYPVETHPIFADLEPRQIVEIKKLITGTQPVTDDDLLTLGPLGEKLYSKLAAGIDSYDAYYPVIRETKYFKNRPNGAPINVRENPPDTFGIGGSWEWLKTAHRITGGLRSWQQVREWTGHVRLDQDLYP